MQTFYDTQGVTSSCTQGGLPSNAYLERSERRVYKGKTKDDVVLRKVNKFTIFYPLISFLAKDLGKNPSAGVTANDQSEGQRMSSIRSEVKSDEHRCIATDGRG